MKEIYMYVGKLVMRGETSLCALTAIYARGN